MFSFSWEGGGEMGMYFRDMFFFGGGGGIPLQTVGG